MTAEKGRRETATPLARAGATTPDATLYDSDFYTWTQRQAEHLRAGRLHSIDVGNIIEEIETLGRSERSALQSAYRLVVMHLLKMRHQPGRRTRSWYATIMRERVRAARLLSENPGLKPRRRALLDAAYADARKEAAAETGLARETFPDQIPFSLEQIEDESFLPVEIDGKGQAAQAIDAGAIDKKATGEKAR